MTDKNFIEIKKVTFLFILLLINLFKNIDSILLYIKLKVFFWKDNYNKRLRKMKAYKVDGTYCDTIFYVGHKNQVES